MNSVAAELAKRWNIELPSQSAAKFQHGHLYSLEVIFTQFFHLGLAQVKVKKSIQNERMRIR